MNLKKSYISSTIALAQNGLSSTININNLVQKKDYAVWEKTLKKETNLRSFLSNKEPYNLMSLSVVVGLSLSESEVTPITAHAKKMMEALDGYLSIFPELLIDKKFIAKLKNLDGMSFISTLCELSLAKYFNDEGFCVGFEIPFNHIGFSTNKDVDLSITEKDGKTFHVEVYMPAHSTEIEGFFSPTDEDYHFEYKVMKKLEDKFGKNGIIGISGKILLAVNISFYDDLSVRDILSNGNFDLFLKAKKHLPIGVDGILFFRDEFVNTLGANSIVVIEK